ncbi:MAG: glucuronyl hydrolase, partial [Duncaniella sp.]|nr:glucuronyl hydrolase [Duncaniella sp.]
MKLTSIIPLMGMALSAAVYTGCVNASAETELDIDGDLAYCNAQIHRTLDELRGNSDSIDYTMMPRNMEGDATCWHCRKADKEEWCGGFWPGILWYNYEATGDTPIRKE